MKRQLFAALALLLVPAALAAGCDSPVTAVKQVAAASELANPASCPAEVTADMREGLPCSVPLGTICAYRVDTTDLSRFVTGDAPVGLRYWGWEAYGCGCASDGVWSSDFSLSPANCPAEEPQVGDDCDQSGSGPCPFYPDRMGWCSPDGWQFEEARDGWVCWGE